jgi:hypothetical protein
MTRMGRDHPQREASSTYKQQRCPADWAWLLEGADHLWPVGFLLACCLSDTWISSDCRDSTDQPLPDLSASQTGPRNTIPLREQVKECAKQWFKEAIEVRQPWSGVLCISSMHTGRMPAWTGLKPLDTYVTGSLLTHPSPPAASSRGERRAADGAVWPDASAGLGL